MAKAAECCILLITPFLVPYYDIILLIYLKNGAFLIKRSVDLWYFLIYLKATVPGLNRRLLVLSSTIEVFLAFFFICDWVNCFLGTFWLTVFRAVCFVRAIFNLKYITTKIGLMEKNLLFKKVKIFYLFIRLVFFCVILFGKIYSAIINPLINKLKLKSF